MGIAGLLKAKAKTILAVFLPIPFIANRCSSLFGTFPLCFSIICFAISFIVLALFL